MLIREIAEASHNFRSGFFVRNLTHRTDYESVHAHMHSNTHTHTDFLCDEGWLVTVYKCILFQFLRPPTPQTRQF